MQRKMRILPLLLLLVIGVFACSDEQATDLQVEALPDVQPNLPQVPTLPPPPHAIQHGDQSYSVFGLRQRLKHTMDTEVDITAYIADVYVPPECPEDNCPPAAAPHMWIADTAAETDDMKRLTVVGYAENQTQIDEAIADAERGHVPELEDGQLAIPVDFAKGAKIKLHGRFTRLSGTGFNISHGLIEYRSHEIVESPPGEGS